MTSLTFDGATWHDLPGPAAVYVAAAALAHDPAGAVAATVDVRPSYEQVPGQRTWDVTVHNVPIEVIRRVDEELGGRRG